jgi:hypothetical protein
MQRRLIGALIEKMGKMTNYSLALYLVGARRLANKNKKKRTANTRYSKTTIFLR